MVMGSTTWLYYEFKMKLPTCGQRNVTGYRSSTAVKEDSCSVESHLQSRISTWFTDRLIAANRVADIMG